MKSYREALTDTAYALKELEEREEDPAKLGAILGHACALLSLVYGKNACEVYQDLEDLDWL